MRISSKGFSWHPIVLSTDGWFEDLVLESLREFSEKHGLCRQALSACSPASPEQRTHLGDPNPAAPEGSRWPFNLTCQNGLTVSEALRWTNVQIIIELVFHVQVVPCLFHVLYCCSTFFCKRQSIFHACPSANEVAAHRDGSVCAGRCLSVVLLQKSWEKKRKLVSGAFLWTYPCQIFVISTYILTLTIFHLSSFPYLINLGFLFGFPGDTRQVESSSLDLHEVAGRDGIRSGLRFPNDPTGSDGFTMLYCMKSLSMQKSRIKHIMFF